MKTNTRQIASLAFSMCATFACAVVLAAEPVTRHAATGDDNSDAVHCLSTIRIKQSDVLDNQNILFEMTDRSTFLNVLPYPCPGLSPQKPFMYRTSINQLCDLDIVTVLDNTGFGLMPGASCGLGDFRPIDEAAAKALKSQSKNRDA
ncbi:MAG TPA: DUF6491 family protein [Woeseiaceae bacterium]|nr:DUF6491 family protein [Woeseiaceae bacterium]